MKKWFQITALALTNNQPAKAEISLRGYIGQQKKAVDWWTGEEYDTGGAGTLNEFEAELKAIANVDEITLRITSSGGDAGVGIAIHNMLSQLKARIVCVIDGYAYSAASLIPMAADEIHMPGNALMMIHDTSDWSYGEPMNVAAHQQAIDMLNAYNDAYAASYAAKTGGTQEEWRTLMAGTLWLTGTEAKARGLVDVITDDVALTAFAPAAGSPLAQQMPEQIRVLFDMSRKTSASAPPSQPESTTDMKPEEIEALLDSKLTAATAKLKTEHESAVTALRTDLEGRVTAAAGEVTELKKTVGDQAALITAQQTELAALRDLNDHGIKKTTASAPAPTAGAGKDKSGDDSDLAPRQRSVTALKSFAVFGTAAKAD